MQCAACFTTVVVIHGHVVCSRAVFTLLVAVLVATCVPTWKNTHKQQKKHFYLIVLIDNIFSSSDMPHAA
jgi:uncharacterized membrane protein YraQ (UPF0718 family)